MGIFLLLLLFQRVTTAVSASPRYGQSAFYSGIKKKKRQIEFYLLNCKYAMQFKEKWLGPCLFNILFLSSDLLYVSEIVFICIFYNKYVWEMFRLRLFSCRDVSETHHLGTLRSNTSAEESDHYTCIKIKKRLHSSVVVCTFTSWQEYPLVFPVYSLHVLPVWAWIYSSIHWRLQVVGECDCLSVSAWTPTSLRSTLPLQPRDPEPDETEQKMDGWNKRMESRQI